MLTLPTRYNCIDKIVGVVHTQAKRYKGEHTTTDCCASNTRRVHNLVAQLAERSERALSVIIGMQVQA